MKYAQIWSKFWVIFSWHHFVLVMKGWGRWNTLSMILNIQYCHVSMQDSPQASSKQNNSVDKFETYQTLTCFGNTRPLAAVITYVITRLVSYGCPVRKLYESYVCILRNMAMKLVFLQDKIAYLVQRTQEYLLWSMFFFLQFTTWMAILKFKYSHTSFVVCQVNVTFNI